MASVVVIKDGLHTPANPATPTVGVVTAEDARLSNGASFTRAPASGLPVRTGVMYHGVRTLLTGTSTTTPSMTIAVSPLAVVCQKAATEGVYVPTSVSTVLLDIDAAPGANSRVDVVYAMQRDAASATSPDTVTQAELGVVTGTAGVSPAKPGIPVGAVEVGTVTVAAGATATTGGQVTIATTCAWTGPLGSPIPVRSQTERDAVTVPTYLGIQVNRLDLGHTEQYDGTAWREPGATSFSRIRCAVQQGIGGGVWAGFNMVADGATRGPVGVLTPTAAGVIVNQSGLYRVTCQLTLGPTTGVPATQGRIMVGATIAAWVTSSKEATVISASADVVIAAGATVYAQVYNTTATAASLLVDGASGPSCVTVTKIPG